MSTIELPAGLRVGLESAGVPMTPEEFDAIEEYDEYHYELIHEVLVVTVYSGQAANPVERRITEGEICRTDLLPGFELPLARLLAAADIWK